MLQKSSFSSTTKLRYSPPLIACDNCAKNLFMKIISNCASKHSEVWKKLLVTIVFSAWCATVGSIAHSQEQEKAGEEQQIVLPATSLPQNSAGQNSAEEIVAGENGAGEIAESDVMPEFTLEEQLDDAHYRFLSYFADELYPQALVAARQTLQLANEYYGSDSLEAALALANVATTQSRTGELAGAVANYKTCIGIIEDHEGIVSPRLVNPLLGLAAAHNDMGDFDRGLRTYNRALRINHVELGLNNSEQMRIRDGLTESYAGLGDNEDANFQQEIQVRIIRQEYDDDLNELLPAIYKLADWYKRSNQPEKEALLLQNAARTIRKAAGDDSNEQIKMLRSLAAAYQRMDMPSEAIRLLKKAWRINNESDTRDPLLSAEIEVEIGDFYNGFNDLRSARRYYTSAWGTLTREGGDDGPELLEKYFGAPVNIWSVRLPDVYPINSKTARLAAENPDLFREGLLVAEYEIDDDGRADNIRIIESDPEGMLDKRVTYLLRRYFYRPRFAEGVPVATEGIQLRHLFSYLPETGKQEASKRADDTGERLEYPGGLN